MAKHRPPMWSSKLYGEPHGAWESEAGSVAAGGAAPASPFARPNERLLYIEEALRDAIRRRVDPKLRKDQQPRTFLENILKKGDVAVVSARRKAEEIAKLTKTEVKVPRVKLSGKIGQQSFLDLLKRVLRFPLEKEEVKILFRQYGHDNHGNMPYELFCRRLFAGASKVLSMQGVQKAAYDPDDKKQWKFNGMIKYPFCKSTVCPPSDWDSGTVVPRSLEQPGLSLQLKHVFGYSGRLNVAPNLFFTKNPEEVVYYTAAVGIVYNRVTNNMRFFQGPQAHDNDIASLAIHPADLDTVATGQFGVEPCVKVWSAATLELKAVLAFNRGEQAIIACAFSIHDEGKRIATVSTDNAHTVSLWDWEAQKRIATGNGYNGQPPQVFGVVWNPYKNQEDASPFDFVTFGTKHVSFWTFDEAENQLSSKGCSFGPATQQDVFHAVFLPTGQLLTAGENGRITVWEGNKAVAEPKPGHAGKMRAMRMKPDLKTLLTAGDDGVVKIWELDVAEDGPVAIGELPPDVPLISSDGGSSGALIALDIHASEDEVAIVGSAENDIWEVDTGAQITDVRVEGMSGNVGDIAVYPIDNVIGVSNPASIYAVPSEDGNLYLFNTETKQGLRAFEIKRYNAGPHRKMLEDEVLRARTAVFSAKGDKLAVSTTGVVGNEDHVDRGGVIQIFEVTEKMLSDDADDGEDDPYVPYPPKDRKRNRGAPPPAGGAGALLMEIHDVNDPIDALAFSPDGRFLAAGSRENYIDIYEADRPFKRVGRCRGHSSYITHLDWSINSSVLMSNSADYEVLHWSEDQVSKRWDREPRSQRDTEWATWTCNLGFPVMGIWQNNMDGSDINGLHRSHAGRHVIYADDLGLVRMMNYPAVVEKVPEEANCLRFQGHASFVPSVRWLADDRHIISVGGSDCSLFQWEVVRNDQATGGGDPVGLVAGGLEAIAEGKGVAEASGPSEGHRRATRRQTDVAGKSKSLAVELRVRELQGMVKDQEKMLLSKQKEIEKLTELLGI